MIVLELLAIGVVIGFITTHLLGQKGRDRAAGIVLATLGALIGGWVFGHYAGANAPNAEISSLVIGANSAVLLAMIYRAVTMNRQAPRL